MSKFICSKLSCDNAYTIWKKPHGSTALPRAARQVLIKGGAGVANNRVITPYGVVTEITDDQYKVLKENCHSFNRHIKGGFLQALESNPRENDIKKISKDLNEDKSTPLTPQKLKSEGKNEGKSSKSSDKK